MAPSSACRPEALEYLRSQLPRLSTIDGLFGAAVAISMHALDDVRPEDAFKRLDVLADQVRGRVAGQSPQAVLAHLHAVLFDEHGFRGNIEHYYSPLNSYLPAVLENGLGIPITLCLVYKTVADRVGLTVEGINAPGHFLVQVHEGPRRILIDPFDRGRMLTHDEAIARIQQLLGHEFSQPASCLEIASHATWILRILANLAHIFSTTRCEADLAAMMEMKAQIEEQLA